MLGQGVFFAVWGGLPYFIWGFVVRVLFTMHMTWSVPAAGFGAGLGVPRFSSRTQQ
jgi:fatty-acid desaturase